VQEQDGEEKKAQSEAYAVFHPREKTLGLVGLKRRRGKREMVGNSQRRGERVRTRMMLEERSPKGGRSCVGVQMPYGKGEDGE